MVDILIRNADWIVTVDEKRRIIRNASLAVEDEIIVAVGKSDDLAKRYSADKVIDAHGKLVLPGLIDTHVHNTQQLGRGLADGTDVTQHLLERLYGYETVLSSEDAYWSAMLAQLEMIKAGTTFFMDPGSYYPDQTVKALGKSGMKGIVARTAFDVHESSIGRLPQGMFIETTEEAVSRAEEIVIKYNGAHDSRVKAWFQLRLLSKCSDELCKKIWHLVKKYKVGLMIHACESRDEAVASRIKYGEGDVERLGRLGCLGPNVHLIHMGWTTPQELTLVKKFKVNISQSPATSLRLGLGNTTYGSFPELLSEGVSVSLSSDAAMSGNFLDIIRQMFLSSGGAKEGRLNATLMPPETMVEMATINGAKCAMAESDTGSLSVGKKADITIIDTRRAEWLPIHNPIANLVYCANGGSVNTVIVNGRLLMEDRKMTAMDEESVYDECQFRAEQIGIKSGLANKVAPKWPIV